MDEFLTPVHLVDRHVMVLDTPSPLENHENLDPRDSNFCFDCLANLSANFICGLICTTKVSRLL